MIFIPVDNLLFFFFKKEEEERRGDLWKIHVEY
jgi:hypothetical protein